MSRVRIIKNGLRSAMEYPYGSGDRQSIPSEDIIDAEEEVTVPNISQSNYDFSNHYFLQLSLLIFSSFALKNCLVRNLIRFFIY